MFPRYLGRYSARLGSREHSVSSPSSSLKRVEHNPRTAAWHTKGLTVFVDVALKDRVYGMSYHTPGVCRGRPEFDG